MKMLPGYLGSRFPDCHVLGTMCLRLCRTDYLRRRIPRKPLTSRNSRVGLQLPEHLVLEGGSRDLKYECAMISAWLPSFVCFGIRGRSCSNFQASTVISGRGRPDIRSNLEKDCRFVQLLRCFCSLNRALLGLLRPVSFDVRRAQRLL